MAYPTAAIVGRPNTKSTCLTVLQGNQPTVEDVEGVRDRIYATGEWFKLVLLV